LKQFEYARPCTGANVFDNSDIYRMEEDENAAYFLAGGRKPRSKLSRLVSENKNTDKKPDHLPSSSRVKKSQDIFGAALIRVDKVRAAKIKKQRGDYNSEEVYRKIADRLMDLFGIK
jgi:hypothetical protein